jgi:hypothetical protein
MTHRIDHARRARLDASRTAAREEANELARLPRRTGARPTRQQWRRLWELAAELGRPIPRRLNAGKAEALIRRWRRERRGR